MLDVLTLTQASCAAPMTFYDSFAVTLSIFVGLSLAGIGAMALIDRRQRQRDTQELQHKVLARAAVGAMTGRTTRKDGSAAHHGIGHGTKQSASDRDRDATDELQVEDGRDEKVAGPSTTARGLPVPGDRGISEVERSGTTGSKPPTGGRRGRGARRLSVMSQQAQRAGVLEQYTKLKRTRWRRVFSNLSMFWLLCYPGVSVKLMRVFVCREVQDNWWREWPPRWLAGYSDNLKRSHLLHRRGS